MTPPQPDPEDLRGEIERLRGELREARERLTIVEHAGIVIDLDRRCCWWHKVRMAGPH